MANLGTDSELGVDEKRRLSVPDDPIELAAAYPRVRRLRRAHLGLVRDLPAERVRPIWTTA